MLFCQESVGLIVQVWLRKSPVKGGLVATLYSWSSFEREKCMAIYQREYQQGGAALHSLLVPSTDAVHLVPGALWCHGRLGIWQEQIGIDVGMRIFHGTYVRHHICVGCKHYDLTFLLSFAHQEAP